MSNFENLEDNFQKKAQEPIKTDQQKMHEHNQQLSDRVYEDKPKYEESITKNPAVSGLAAMFQQRLEEVTQQGHEDGDTEGTVTFSTDAVVRYGDQAGIPENEVSEEDIQRFVPSIKYGETIKESTNANTIKEDAGRHTEDAKYGDSFVVEHHTASIRDVSPKNKPIAETGTYDNSPDRTTDDEISQHIADHRRNKTKASESEVDDNTDISIPTTDIGSPSEEVSGSE